ncbi:VanW family protein [Lachnospiraceae bacterium HCP1S3_A8]
MSTVNRSSGTGRSRDAAGTTGTGTRRQTGAGSTSGRAASSRTSSARATSTTRQASGGGSSAARRQTSTGSTARRQTSSGRVSASRSTSSYRSPRRRRRDPNYGVIAIVGVILMIVIVSVVYGMQSSGRHKPIQQETETETVTEVPETELEKEVSVDGISITGMSREEARQTLIDHYPWAMKAQYQDDTYEITNLITVKIDGLLDEIYSSEPKNIYTLDASGLDTAVDQEIESMKARWNKAAKNGSISSYDASSDSFTFAGEQTGIAINEEQLKSDIQSALSAKQFDKVITVSASEVQPEYSTAAAKQKYKTIGTYTTNTTSNSKRNTNIRLAAEALNGTIVGPGQEVSFNDTVGQRTEAKGYQGAAAYNNGEVVQEIGGGVCQVSTTLYNAALKAGMKISMRRSHTFEPSYVTPGMDATVSWGGPDFRFINTSSSAIGIKASYSNQTVTVSIYGVPVLEDGVTYSLEATKTETFDLPEPQYEEDQTLQPGQEVVKSKGTQGSRWQVKLVVKKDGQVISSEVDHTATYKGHNPVIRRNTSGVVIGGETESAAESTSQTTETTAAAETTEGEVGPGVAPTTAPAAPATTAAETPVSEPAASPDRQPADDGIVAPKPAD